VREAAPIRILGEVDTWDVSTPCIALVGRHASIGEFASGITGGEVYTPIKPQ
jgi:hypothetical protein